MWKLCRGKEWHRRPLFTNHHWKPFFVEVSSSRWSFHVSSCWPGTFVHRAVSATNKINVYPLGNIIHSSNNWGLINDNVTNTINQISQFLLICSKCIDCANCKMQGQSKLKQKTLLDFVMQIHVVYVIGLVVHNKSNYSLLYLWSPQVNTYKFLR